MSASSTDFKSSVLDQQSRPLAALMILIMGSIILLLAVILSIFVGSRGIAIRTVWDALFHFNPSIQHHQVIWQLRMPRALAGVMVGASLAVAGAIMQGMTRNPMADAGLLGLNAGAGLALAVCFALFPTLSKSGILIATFMGAGLGAFIVYGVGSLSRNGLSPVRLTLSGAAVSALFVALSEGIALYFHIGQDLSFWLSGGLAGTNWAQVYVMFPWVVAALVGSCLLARSITMLSLGEEVALGLGMRSGWVKVAAIIVVLILAGASVSAAGMVVFVGLVVPHIVRFLVGVDYRWIIPCSAVMGGLLMVLADILAISLNPMHENPVGALISLIGVPFFLIMIRKSGRGMK
ncbi:iron complex transport system permease protein [Paenibacillus shirakamiensis]|uniref:Iron complex transport system permease protein n=2 Tax=Paenibacillus shirakamiensis TaxID=1265935 RepID=A0ABS4JGS0_9BACL|nr:iron complex transport system permease protein [Paenibacillus shirakamiensis]